MFAALLLPLKYDFEDEEEAPEEMADLMPR